MADNILVFYGFLFLVAFLYASVGHGGASGYLALMAIAGFAPAVMKPTALLLNVFVSLTSFIQFWRGKHFNWKIFWPLAIASVPLAFIGGTIALQGDIYKKILGVVLLFPVARFFFFANTAPGANNKSNTGLSFLMGAAIGFLSGLIGIGGGIILSPLLILMKWTDQKQTAAISALFIFVNSIAGLAGQLSKGIQFNNDMAVYVAIAFSGGLCGAYFGAMHFKQDWLKKILALVLLVAACKLLFTNA
jgi:uncharacterized protein